MPTLRGICTPDRSSYKLQFPLLRLRYWKSFWTFQFGCDFACNVREKTLSNDVLLRLKSVIPCLHNNFVGVHSLPGLCISVVQHENRWLVSVTIGIIKLPFLSRTKISHWKCIQIPDHTVKLLQFIHKILHEASFESLEVDWQQMRTIGC